MAVQGWSKPLTESLLTLRLTLPGLSRGGEWKAALEQVIADLDELNGSTERDFLAVGGKLMEFRGCAKQVSAGMSALTELISGEPGQHASEALAGILEYSKDLDARIAEGGRTLTEVCAHSAHIRQAFSGLRDMVAVFGTMCTLTRIETSRLGNSGTDFGDLTAEVKPLSESIQKSGAGVLDACTRLDERVQSALASASDLRGRQLKELPALISGVVASLQAFEARQEQAITVSADRATQYEAIGAAIDEVVRSVQFHDITRQQIEHVVEALRQLAPAGQGKRGESGGPRAGSAAVLSLQVSHLDKAAGIFARSIAEMQRGLDSIGRRAQEMAEESRELMCGKGENSFLLQMEGQFTTILNLLSSCSAAQEQMEATAGRLGETIGRMRDWVVEIRGIEIRIQRIAMNATIRATHIGAAGDPLNVIAEEMQRLAADSNRHTEDVDVTLGAMSAAASGLGNRLAGAAGDGAAGRRDVIGDMRRSLLELHGLSECSFTRVQQIMTGGSSLAKAIAGAQAGFSAGARFAEVMERARRELTRLAGKLGDASLGLEGTAPDGRLEDLANRYTMQMERDVHQAALEGTAQAAVVDDAAQGDSSRESEPVLSPAAGPGAGSDEELGDNIELF